MIGGSDLVKGPWYDFKNESGETIPAYAVMRLDGTATVDTGDRQRRVLSMQKPNKTGAQFAHFINGPTDIADDDFGMCTRGLCEALLDTADGTAAAGEAWGPISGSWKLRQDVGGFYLVDQIESGRALVIPAPFLFGKATLNADLNPDANASADLVKDSTDTTHDVTIEEYAMIDSDLKVENGDKVIWCYDPLTNAYVAVGSEPCPVEA